MNYNDPRNLDTICYQPTGRRFLPVDSEIATLKNICGNARLQNAK